MNTAIVPFRLLIINDSQQEAQRLMSMFQNAGKPCRAQYVNTEEAFIKIIEEQHWDLVIAHSGSESLTPATTIKSIRKYNHDLPVILLMDDDGGRTVVDGMKLGACDVVRLDDDQHLLLVVSRELSNRQQRHAARMTERKFKELERRNQQLLDSSKDGIAFIQDGTYVYANDSFAEMVGYSSRSDIEYLPLMDMIDSQDHERVKQALKSLPLHQEGRGEKRLSFNVKTATSDLKQIELELNMGRFEEETCIQFILQANLIDNETLAAELETIKYTDSITGLHNQTYIHSQLQQIINDTTETDASYAYYHLSIDQFEEQVLKVVGIDGAEQVLITIAGFLQQHYPQEAVLARMGDHAFGIISQESAIETLLKSGDQLCELINSNFFEVDNKTLQLSASIGITTITETTVDTQMVISQANEAIESLRKSGKNGNGATIYQNSDADQIVLASALQKALDGNQFRLLFQPIISLHGDETERYEVLLRMIDEDNQEISPTHFMQTANSMNIVSKIDRWVILEAIKHLSQNGKPENNAQLFVNISNQSLCDQSLLPWLKVAFNAAKVDPACVIFQAQEVDISQHLTAAKKFIEEAALMGVSFCISHFGCALDPVSLFEHIDVEHIKIDGSFSLEIQEAPDDTEALEKLLADLHEHNKTITVPFIENASILSKLWKMGVHCIQGHYLQPPSVDMDYEFTTEQSN